MPQLEAFFSDWREILVPFSQVFEKTVGLTHSLSIYGVPWRVELNYSTKFVMKGVRKKTKSSNFRIEKIVFREFYEVSGDAWPNGRHHQLERQILLQIDLF